MPFDSRLSSRIAIALGLALGTPFVCAPLLSKGPVAGLKPVTTTRRRQARRGAGRCGARARARGDSRPRHHARHARRHQRRQLHRGLQLHAAADNQVNLPKMEEGGLDVSFMIVYVGQGAADARGLRQRVQAGDREIRRHPSADEGDRARTRSGCADAGRRARASPRAGRKVAVIGVENGYPIGTDIKRVKEFYERGGRYMSLAHNGHSQLSDSNTGEATNMGCTAGCRRSASR